MSITGNDHAISPLNRSIAITLRRFAAWLETPPRADKRLTLPRELEDAEDWLLADLGLKESDDRLLPPTASEAKVTRRMA